MGRKNNRQRRVHTNHRLPLTNFVPYDQTSVINYSTGELRSLSNLSSYAPTGTFRAQNVFQSPVSHFTTKNTNVGRRSQAYKSYLPTSSDVWKTSAVVVDHPLKTLVCVGRKIRREVLFAFNKTGKGGQRPPRRTRFSSVKC